VRANPTVVLADLQAILCTAYHPVPSPGKLYDAAFIACKVLNAPLWSLTSRMFAGRRGRSVDEYCDEQVRKLLKVGQAAQTECKTTNMGEDGIYVRADGVRVQTVEGRSAVIEAIEFIKAQKPLTALEWNTDMWKSCRDHAEEQAAIGSVGHLSANGDTPFIRMNRYGWLVPPAGENLAWGA